MTCACGNAARYINERGELCCGTCPIGERIDSIRISDVPSLLAWARSFVNFSPHREPISEPPHGITEKLRSIIGVKP